MSFEANEISTYNAEPIELYEFSYNGVSYTYTSANKTMTVYVNGNSYTFNKDYIKRSDSLKLGNNGSEAETCTITVARNNEVALLYQGAPPEEDSVNVSVYRVHNSDGTELSSEDYVKILDGVVSQVTFTASEATLTINIENVLSRNIPRGKLSYYCQNCIYDYNCTLSESAYTITVSLSNMDGLTLTSPQVAAYEDGYFNDGFIKMGSAYRQVKSHKGNTIIIKYPINEADKSRSFTICPGCDGLFNTCATKYSNTDNFSGIPYIEPYNAFTNPTGKGGYWLKSGVVARDTNGKVYE